MLNYELIQYGIGQGRGQLKVVWNAKPVEEMLNDKFFPDSLKQKLKLVQEIKQFCFDSLGLKHSENYSGVYDQHNKPILWNVTACNELELKPYEWNFPFLGNVPYKGFFNKESAKKEADRLRAEDYDVYSYPVGGWSTLGWFKDPLLSNMLKSSEGNIANLIIHELMHGTLYVKNNATFNENLASFVGDKGTKFFLKKKFGKDSSQLKKYLDDKADDDLFSKYCFKFSENLDSLYKSTSSDKKKRKATIISNFIDGIDSLKLNDKKSYKKYGERAKDSKNAFFLSFIRYESQQIDFEKEFREKFNSDIRKYINYLKWKYSSI